MSWHRADGPSCTARGDDVVLVIRPRRKDLGDFHVRRVLPAEDRPRVGPFVFFDHMGPATFPPGRGINVRPHPHIGLATVTYLFEGEILHRDGLGYVQAIQPGAVNLMTAGRGIVHSERTAEALLESGQRLHGLQTWMALPDGKEEIDPAFEHVPAGSLPVHARDGVTATVILGSAFGCTAPIATHADSLYADLQLEAGTRVELPRDAAELAAYVVAGGVRVGACRLDEGSMGVLREDHRAVLEAEAVSRVVLIGGETLGERRLWWNFVASSAARIERAKADWREGRFGGVPGDDEFIPLPEPD